MGLLELGSRIRPEPSFTRSWMRLPETELPAAEEALRRLGSAAVLQALDQAPLDNEPDDDDLDSVL